MSALGPQFDQHVADFRDRMHGVGEHEGEPGPETEAGSFGRCYDVARAFHRHLADRGVKSSLHEVAIPADDDGDGDQIPHGVVKVSGHIVDWTARQFGFHPEPHFPTIMPTREYRRSFGAQPAAKVWPGDDEWEPDFRKTL